MQRYFVIALALVIFVVLGFCGSAYARDAEEYDRGWINVSVMSSALFPDSGDLGETLYLSGRVSYDVSPYVALGVESGWFETSDVNGNVKYGDITAVPVLGVVVFKYPIEQTDNKLVPYAIGGAGIIIYDYDEETILNNRMGGNSDIDDGIELGLKGGVGADYYFTDNTAVFVEGSYLWSSYEIEDITWGNGVRARGGEDVDGSWTIGGGLKYSF